MVGARGFEPPAYGTQNRRATRLRYAPTAVFLNSFCRNEKAFHAKIITSDHGGSHGHAA